MDELKKIYTTDKYKWMTVISIRDTENSYYNNYKLQKTRLTNILKYLKLNRTDHIVDYGCGNGLLLDAIHDRISFYDGIDFSEDYIRLARERQRKNSITNAQFFNSEICEFCQKNPDKYDIAFAMDFSEHIDDDDFKSIFSSIRNSLKPSGRLYILTPNAAFFIEKLKQIGILKQFEEHIGVRDDIEYENMLKNIGFSEINMIYIPHYIKYISYFNLISNMPLIGRYFRARLLIQCVK